MSDFFCEELSALKAQARKYRAAITWLLDPKNMAAEYTLDTGQDRQQVKRQDVNELQLSYNGLLSQIASLEALCNGGSTQMVPLC